MATRHRSDQAGAVSFVTNRGTAQTAIYRDDQDRRVFLNLLGQLETRFHTAVLAFVLMGNHFHLLVRSGDGRLSETMQWLEGRHAQSFNARHGRTGALFQGRYHARLVTTEHGMAAAGAYLHLNPLRAGLVADPAAYRWSSLPSYVRGRTPLPWLRLDLLGGMNGPEYRSHLEQVDPLSTRCGAGDPFDVSWLAEAVSQGEADAGSLFEASDRRVAQLFRGSIDEIYVPTRGRVNLIRSVGVLHAARTTGLQLALVAARYGLTSASAIQTIAVRLRRRSESDPALSAILSKLDLEV